jgi:hypothetical protein
MDPDGDSQCCLFDHSCATLRMYARNIAEGFFPSSMCSTLVRDFQMATAVDVVDAPCSYVA